MANPVIGLSPAQRALIQGLIDWLPTRGHDREEWEALTACLALDDRVKALIDSACREVAELPNRTSPDDWPEAMLVTADELAAILSALLRRPQATEET